MSLQLSYLPFSYKEVERWIQNAFEFICEIRHNDIIGFCLRITSQSSLGGEFWIDQISVHADNLNLTTLISMQ